MQNNVHNFVLFAKRTLREVDSEVREDMNIASYSAEVVEGFCVIINRLYSVWMAQIDEQVQYEDEYPEDIEPASEVIENWWQNIPTVTSNNTFPAFYTVDNTLNFTSTVPETLEWEE